MEPTTLTHLSHTDGAVSAARYAVGTASNEFTIVVGDMTYLDAGGTATPDKQGYARCSGHVVLGHGCGAQDSERDNFQGEARAGRVGGGDFGGAGGDYLGKAGGQGGLERVVHRNIISYMMRDV